MTEYLPEFLGFATVHIMSLISPGPDFMMVLRTSLRQSRKTALFVALGIACGECIHVSYCVLGLGALVQESENIMTLLRYLGAAYLVYIGIQSLLSKKDAAIRVDDALLAMPSRPESRSFGAWRLGFFTNILNVKAAFFTISCFAVFVGAATPLSVRSFYGVFIVVTTMIWFSFVVLCLTNGIVREGFIGAKHWIERSCGLVLVYFGVQLAFGELMVS